ncbi:MAG: acyltransferase family protein [Candidatus Thorarchaeota archaeon]
MTDNTEIMSETFTPAKSRIFYVDNIRIYLTVLVILHHITIGYGGSGGWLVNESDFYTIDSLTIILFTLFNTINQSYFMAFFFLLAGFFTPRSFEKKGGKTFSKDRLVRLGIPLVIYAALVSPITEFIVRNYAYAQNWTFEEIIANRINNIAIGVDHLWFLLALLFFAGFYVLFRKLRPTTSSNESTSSFPKDKVIFAAIIVVALISFCIRIVSPIGFTFFFNFQFGHFTHYAFMFWIGILAYQRNWFENLEGSQAKRWIEVAILVVILLPIVLVFMIDLSNPDIAPFLGGLTFESFIFSFWDSFALLSISIGVLYIFKNKLNRSNKISQNMGGSAYTAYIIHAIIIIILQILLLPLILPAFLKAVIVAVIGVPLIFILSALIRRIPGFSLVFG